MLDTRTGNEANNSSKEGVVPGFVQFFPFTLFSRAHSSNFASMARSVGAQLEPAEVESIHHGAPLEPAEAKSVHHGAQQNISRIVVRIGVFLSVAGVYLTLMSRTISGGDAGELAACACSGAVAHPPGETDVCSYGPSRSVSFLNDQVLLSSLYYS